jgi:hypothetical protein
MNKKFLISGLLFLTVIVFGISLNTQANVMFVNVNALSELFFKDAENNRNAEKIHDGNDSKSNLIALHNPPSSRSTYCTFSTSSPTPRYINSFQTTNAETDISNLSSGPGNPNPGYTDFSSIVLETYETQIVDFTIGLGGSGQHGASIYVDWNNDFVFDFSEKVYSSGGFRFFPLSGTLTTPFGTPVGQYRMRVVIDFNASSPGACSGISAEAEDYTLEVVAPPSCLLPSGLSVAYNSLNAYDLSWTENGSATTWEIEYGAEGFIQGNGTTINAVNSNPYTLTGLMPEIDYEFYVRSDCGGNGFSEWVGPFAFDSLYCDYTISSSFPRYIASFQTTNAEVNLSNLNSGPGNPNAGYTDFTSMVLETYETQTFNFTISVDGVGQHAASIFVDWNKDYVFDASERVYSSGTYVTFPLSGSVIIPTSTPGGQYRMRVITDFSLSDPPACSGISAEAEDYTLKVVTPPICLQPSNLSVANLSLSAYDLSWTENGSATTWEIEYGAEGFIQGNGTTINTVNSNPYTLTGLTPEIDYEFYVRADCGGSSFSEWVGPFTFDSLYCDYTTSGPFPRYIASFLTTNAEVNISNLSSGPGMPNPGYTDFTSVALEAYENQTFNFTISVDGVGQHAASIFVDWNKDYVFDASEKVYSSGTYVFFPLSGTVTVPLSTPVGQYRMRVVTDFSNPSPGACSGSSAEAEDYTLKVVNQASCLQPNALTASNITTTTADLGWTSNGTATIWNIEYGSTGFSQGSGTDVTGINTNPYALTGLTASTTYEFYVQSDCGSSNLSTWAGPFAFTTLCLSTTGDTTATACESFEWYGTNYTSSGSATHTLQNAAGCDSIVTLDLTIEESNSAGNDNSITVCMNEPVDIANLLSSIADTGGTWLDPTYSPLVSSEITASSTSGNYNYSYIVSAAGCPADTAVFTITVDQGCDYLSIDKDLLSDISVYPNPTSDLLNIVNPSNNSSLKIEMLDMNGRIVMLENKVLKNSSETTIAITHLEKGIYTLRIYNEEGQKTFKIVKQ